MLAWGFFVNTVLVYHGTFSVNSLTHVFGSRRFPTTDNSRNSFWIAVLTLGEGWHNNHHYVPSSERQGFYFWEVDIAHYMLVSLSSLGLVWDLQKPPRHVLNKTAWLPEGIG
jgi:stearoyl-CoA desaturase (delta-9 desaturase)